MARGKKVQSNDKPEVRAGIIGAILALMPAALAAVRHRVLNTVVAEYEAAKTAWMAAAAHLTQVEKEVKQAEAEFGALIKALPIVATVMLRIDRPVPGNTDYTKLDKGVRFDDLVGWIRAGGTPEELHCAQALEEFRDRCMALRPGLEEATAKEHETKQVFGKERIKLVATVRETDQFIRLNADSGSPAGKALAATRRKGKKSEKQPATQPAANTDAVTPAPVPIAKPA